MQIRTVTRQKASNWASAARVHGTDIGEVMDRAGVLLTPERLAAVRAGILEQMAQFLEDTPTSQLTGFSRPVTVTDFQNIIARLLRHEANTERERVKK